VIFTVLLKNSQHHKCDEDNRVRIFLYKMLRDVAFCPETQQRLTYIELFFRWGCVTLTFCISKDRTV